ncbi:sensor histidine kinase [Anaerosinus massiliensis]|uniref:sensor histidine kinase n=1 Tax=Massilibacillus massiliensis TaxID=1806837 RepID=UPI000AD4C3D5|nr:sensor histidine kinase [Massilibacillus massiliensis]
MQDSLLFQMVERMSMAATLAFILSQTSIFRRINYSYVSTADKVKIAIIFGLIGITGTYAGIPVHDALANSRVIGVMAAGLIGGPTVGVMAGFVAGGHRYFMGGFTAFSCSLANICEGLLAGLIRRYYPSNPVPWWVALLSGIVGETMQMCIILLTAKPFDMAYALVENIAVPMIVANSIGLAIFMLIIKTTMDVQLRAGAMQAQKALMIAAQTLPYFRRGLYSESAKAAARIVYEKGGYHAVAVTDTEKVLAFIGVEAQHHLSENKGFTKATNRALISGDVYIARTPAEIGCKCQKCSLTSAIIVPLKCGKQVIGTFKLYHTNSNLLNESDVVFANGLADLFSIQLELAEIDRQTKQAAHAELKALQAQINPHFLFNTLNTIISLVRTQPELARELLVKLSSIFRFTLRKTGRNITLSEEITQVRAYLAIEKARCGEKLTIREEIDVNADIYMIPSLTIQPIIENAIVHGLKRKIDGGTIILHIEECEEAIKIKVMDDGIGMDLSKKNPLQETSEGHIGLKNVDERLHSQYGVAYGVTLESVVNQGTTVTIKIPKIPNSTAEDDACAKSFDY